jgi:hypothetical protein
MYQFILKVTVSILQILISQFSIFDFGFFYFALSIYII